MNPSSVLFTGKRVLFCLLIFSIIAGAQTVDNTQIVGRLTADLLGMKDAVTASDPLKDEVSTTTELQSLITYSQGKVIRSLEMDLMKYEVQYYPVHKGPDDARVQIKSFFTGDLGYKLTTAIAEKDLSERNLTPLVQAIVGMVGNALECRDNHSRLQNSVAFRQSAESAWMALKQLGVHNPDLRIVMDALFRGAESAASPPLRTTYK
jgi:hypothetical protein